jgi:hypothetical protein
VRRSRNSRGIALATVLLATALLLVLVAVLVDLGTIQLQRSTADLRSLQALAGADGGTAWVRAELEREKGDVEATIVRLGQMQGKHRFTIDDRSYVIVSVLLITASQETGGDHVDENLESNPQVVEAPVQVEASATVYTDDSAVARRSTTTLLRVFPAAPYSAVVGFIDDGGPVGIDSPGDSGGQVSGAAATELLVHAYTVDGSGQHHEVDDFNAENWSDGNTQGPGPLP